MLNRIMTVTVLITICLLCSCDSNGDVKPVKAALEELPAPPVVLDNSISGPLSVYEETTAIFSLEIESSDDLEYLWTIEPTDSGVIGTPTFREVGFYAASIPGDSNVEAVLAVDVMQDGEVVETRSRTIEIVNLDEPRSWIRQWRAGGIDTNNDMCVDSFGNIYVTGETWPSGDLDPGLGRCVAETPDSSLAHNSYISKFTVDGEYLWSRWWSAEDMLRSDCGLGIDTDSAGNIYVIGTFSGKCDFDPGPGVVERESQLNGDSYTYSHYVASFKPDGDFRWVRVLHGYSNNRDTDIFVGQDDAVLCVGEFTEWALEGTVRDTDSGIDYGHPYLVMMNTDGEILWYIAPYQMEDNSFYAQVRTATSDNAGNIFIAGTFTGRIDLDPGDGISLHGSTDTSQAHNQAFVSAYNPPGHYIWSRAYSPNEDGNASAFSICTDNSNVYITGYFSGKIYDDSGNLVLESTRSDEGWNELNAWVSSITRDGQYRWAISWGSQFHNLSEDICIDPCGFVYVTGSYTGVQNESESVAEYGSVARLSTDGELLWLGAYNDWSLFEGSAVGCDDDCNIYAMGEDRHDRQMCLAKFAQGEYW
jgi:hypothetical protein